MSPVICNTISARLRACCLLGILYARRAARHVNPAASKAEEKAKSRSEQGLLRIEKIVVLIVGSYGWLTWAGPGWLICVGPG